MKKSGFTLIELIYVITIMGVVGAIINMTLGQVYYNYAQQKEFSRLESTSTLVITQVKKLLQRSVPNSIMRYSDGGTNEFDSNNYTPLLNITNGDLKNANERLIWLDIDRESLRGTGPQPYYNQWFNLKTSDGVHMYSVDSDFTKIINTENSTLLLTGVNSDPAVYYIYGNQQGTPYEKFYNSTQTALFPIDKTQPINNNDFYLTRTPKEIGEMFYIVDTGYSLHLNNKTLMLTHDYQPWTKNGANQETFLDGTSEILLENVSEFKYWVEYDTLKIKICVDSKIPIGIDAAGNNRYSSLCKEAIIGAF